MRILLPVAFLMLATCTKDRGDPRNELVIRDSAGVQIVENENESWAPGAGWQVSKTAGLQIGVEDGDSAYQLYRLTGARRLSDGRIVVANGGSLQLRFFDSAGKFLNAVGRAGEGPGEFRALTRLDVMRGDTLLVFDGTVRRVSVFTDRGAFVRSLPLPSIEDRAFPRPRGGVFEDGSILAYTERGAPPPKGGGGVVVREPGLYYLLDARTDSAQVIGEFPIRGFYLHSRLGNVLIPYEPHPWPIASGDAFYFGAGRTFEIGVYTRQGQLRRLMRWARPAVPVTASDVERFMQNQLERVENDSARAQQAEALRTIYPELPIPKTKPAHSELLIDTESNVWVAEYRPPGQELTAWFVLDPQGQLLGRVETPASLTVYQIGADFVLGRTSDALGIERVEMYTLIKTR